MHGLPTIHKLNDAEARRIMEEKGYDTSDWHTETGRLPETVKVADALPVCEHLGACLACPCLALPAVFCEGKQL